MQSSGEMSREAAKVCLFPKPKSECHHMHKLSTVTLRCSPRDATRRVESLEGRQARLHLGRFILRGSASNAFASQASRLQRRALRARAGMTEGTVSPRKVSGFHPALAMTVWIRLWSPMISAPQT